MDDRYMVKGKSKSSQDVFYNIDSSSGYPYASTFGGKETSSLSGAVGWLDACKPGGFAAMHDAVVVRVTYEPVDVSSFIKTSSAIFAQASELTDEEAAIMLVALQNRK